MGENIRNNGFQDTVPQSTLTSQKLETNMICSMIVSAFCFRELSGCSSQRDPRQSQADFLVEEIKLRA